MTQVPATEDEIVAVEQKLEKSVKPITKTAYTVLRLRPEDDTWTVDGPIQRAISAQAAVKQAVALRGESDVTQEGVYVAVPERSWQPVKVTIEQTTVVKLG